VAKPEPGLAQLLARFGAWYRLTRTWRLLQAVLFAWCVAVALLIGLDKVVYLPLEQAQFAQALGAAAVLLVLGHFLLQRRQLLRMGYEVDRAAGLRNLVATAVELQGQTDTVSGLVRGRATSALARLSPLEVFRFRLTWPGRYLALAMVALVAVWFAPEVDLGGRRAAAIAKTQERQDVQRGALRLKEELSQIERLDKLPEGVASKQITKDLRNLGEKLEQLDKQQALQAIGEFEHRYQEEFAAARQFDQSAKYLPEKVDPRELNDAAAEQLQNLLDSMRQGDQQKAAEALRHLAKQLGDKSQTPAQQEALRRELQKLMAQSPGEAAQKLAKSLQQMPGSELKPGEQGQPGEQGNKPGEQGKPGEEGTKPGDQGSKPSEQGQPGEQGQQTAQQQMEEMANELEQMESLEQMREGLAQAKESMMGEGFGGLDEKSIEERMRQEASLGMGEGGEQGEGQGEGEGEGGEGNGNGKGGTGGRGQGQGGKVAENRTDTSFKSELSNSRINQGKIVNQLSVYGVPDTGEAREEYTGAVLSAKQAAAGALARSKVPREYENMVRNYFDTLTPQEPATP